MRQFAMPMCAVVCMLCAACSGCKSLNSFTPDSEDVSTRRKERKDQVVASFESRRTFAQMQAAQSRLEHGDLPGCVELLQSVLQRDPGNRVAQAMLQDVELARLSDPVSPVGSVESNEHYAMHPASHEDSTLHFVPEEFDRAVYDAPIDEETTQSASYESIESAGRTNSVGEAPIRNANPALDEAAALLSSGQFVEARRSLLNLLDSPQATVQLANSAAVISLRYNYPEFAVEIGNLALNRFAPSSPLYRTISLAHYRRGDYESAQTALQQALSLDNGHPLTYFLLGHTKAKLGDQSGSQWCFAKARHPENDSTR
jgi:tetratricopeptide (TPR) repeat protein